MIAGTPKFTTHKSKEDTTIIAEFSTKKLRINKPVASRTTNLLKNKVGIKVLIK